MDLGMYESARADFQKALHAAEENVQTQIACHLHLSDSYLREENLRLAEEHFQQWRTVEQQIENGVVRDMAKTIHAEIERRRNDFVIPWTEENLSYELHAQRLWDFLLKQAERRHAGKESVAKALGVSRQTLYKRHP